MIKNIFSNAEMISPLSDKYYFEESEKYYHFEEEEHPGNHRDKASIRQLCQ